MDFQRKFVPPKPLAPGLHQGIGLNDLKQITCECGSEIFIPALKVYLASPLQTTTGSQVVVQAPGGLICASCGKMAGTRSVDQDIPQEEASNHVKN